MTIDSAQAAAPARSPVSVDYGTLRQRRMRVMVMYCGYALMCMSFWLADAAPKASGQKYIGLALVFSGFACVAYGFYHLMRRTFINAAHVEDEALDERQRQLRDRATRISYITLSVLLTLQALVVVVGSQWKDANALVIPAGVGNAYFWGAFLLVLTLPTAILAWTTPDCFPDPEK